MQDVSWGLRESLEQDILAKIVAKDVKENDKKIIAVDEIRKWRDIKYLKEMENFIFVVIKANSKIKYQRLVE